MRRATTMEFAPRMHVYPGGRVDAADYDAPIDFLAAPERVAALAERASTDVAGLVALYSCAIREVAEETGIGLVVPDGAGRLVVDPDLLPIADHWVTPEMEGQRYDVRFFAVRMPSGQDAELQTTEGDVAFWVRPADALNARATGDMLMLPPTEATLRYLSGFSTTTEALSNAAARPVLPLLPRRIVDPQTGTRWALVHDRTGELILNDVGRPDTTGAEGLTFPEGLR
jgi:8-oxo-dGTP pyrophosphatase MutT (NUDIX family)